MPRGPLNVLLLGATGMIGAGVLLECLDSPDVASVLALGRRVTGMKHPKLRELVLGDLFEITSHQSELANIDSCFFCLGVTSVGMSEAEYSRVTYELTMAVARTLRAASPTATFIFVSGEGTDSTERGRTMWARVKGKAENGLLGMGFPGAWMFRPGIIEQRRGVKSRTPLYQNFYVVLSPLVSVARRLLPNTVTSTAEIGRAMINIARSGYPVTILRPGDINRAAAMPATPG